MPECALIIPVYNVAPYLDRCLASAVRQSFRDTEIICVDDASTDSSPQILEEWWARDSRVQIITHARNRGLSAARNSGMARAQSRYMYFIDSDDWINPDWLEKMLGAAIGSGADMVLNTSILAWHADGHQSWHFPQRTANNISGVFYPAKFAALNLIWNTWAYVWKSDFIQKHELFFPESVTMEDQCFHGCACACAENIYIIRDSLYNYWKRRDSICARENGFRENTRAMEKLLDFIEERGLVGKFGMRVFTPYILPKNDSAPEDLNRFYSFCERAEKMVRASADLYSPEELEIFNHALLRRPVPWTSPEAYAEKLKTISGALRKNLLKN